MTIHCVDTNNQPAADAVVSISQAPVEVRDIAMITDDNGDVSIEVEAPGTYTFSVNYNDKLYQASANLAPGDSATTIVLR